MSITLQEIRELLRDLTLELDARPVGLLGQATTTTPQTGVTSEVDLTGLSVTVDVPAGRRLKLTASVPITAAAAGNHARAYIKEGSTYLDNRDVTVTYNSGALTQRNGITIITTVTPSAGSHTYKLALFGVLGTVQTNPSAITPAGLFVEDIGPA